MPLLSKETVAFYKNNKDRIAHYLKMTALYENKLTELHEKSLKKDAQIQAITAEYLTLQANTETYQQQKKQIQSATHALLIDLELELSALEQQKYMAHKKESLRFRNPSDKQKYETLTEQYEKLKEEYKALEKPLTEANTPILKKLIEIREQIHFSTQFQTFSAEKKKTIKLGFHYDTEYFQNLFGQAAEKSLAQHHLEQLAANHQTTTELTKLLHASAVKAEKKHALLNQLEQSLKTQAKKSLITMKLALIELWLQLINEAIKHKTIEKTNIQGLQELHSKLDTLIKTERAYEEKARYEQVKKIFSEWYAQNTGVIDSAISFPEFITMRNITTEVEEYSDYNENEKYHLFKEAYFKLFYLDIPCINLLIQQYQIAELNPGLSKLLELFIDKAVINIAIDINALIQSLIQNLKSALHLAEQKSLAFMPQNIGLSEQNYSTVKKIFKDNIAARTPIIENHIKQVFIDNETIRLYLQLNLDDHDFKIAAEKMAKQDFYRAVIDKDIAALIDEKAHIKGQSLTGKTHTLRKIALLNDFLTSMRTKTKTPDYAKAPHEFSQLLKQLNIKFEPDVLQVLISELISPPLKTQFSSHFLAFLHDKKEHSIRTGVATFSASSPLLLPSHKPNQSSLSLSDASSDYSTSESTYSSTSKLSLVIPETETPSATDCNLTSLPPTPELSPTQPAPIAKPSEPAPGSTPTPLFSATAASATPRRPPPPPPRRRPPGPPQSSGTAGL
jgi:hypothetical protein